MLFTSSLCCIFVNHLWFTGPYIDSFNPFKFFLSSAPSNHICHGLPLPFNQVTFPSYWIFILWSSPHLVSWHTFFILVIHICVQSTFIHFCTISFFNHIPITVNFYFFPKITSSQITKFTNALSYTLYFFQD